MSDRRAELEQKKAKLQAIRESKKRREETRKLLADDKGLDVNHTNSTVDLRQTTEEIFRDLGIPTGDELNGTIPEQALQEDGLTEWAKYQFKGGYYLKC